MTVLINSRVVPPRPLFCSTSTTLLFAQVFDDQQDYFNTNSAWLSEKEREKVAARDGKRRDKIKRHGRLRAMKIDFAGRVQIDREGDSDDEAAAGAEKGPAVDSYSGRSGC